MNEFGMQLKKHRGKLTQEAYAKKHGICVKSLRNWEQGRWMPKGDQFLTLIRLIGMPPKVWGEK